MKAMPVRLLIGRLRLGTRPAPTGSLPVMKTIGIVWVAALAASAATRYAEAMTFTRRLIKSAAKAGSDHIDLPPNDAQSPGRGLRGGPPRIGPAEMRPSAATAAMTLRVKIL